MSNEELAEAIKYTSERLRQLAATEYQFAQFNFHLEELLREQRKRAIAATGVKP